MDVIAVDLGRCVGHGRCYQIAPELMEPTDDEGHSAFVGEPFDPSDAARRARARSVVESCPELALSLRRLQQG